MFLLLDLAAISRSLRFVLLRPQNRFSLRLFIRQHNSMLSALAIVALVLLHFTLIFIRVNLNSPSIISSPRSGTLKKTCQQSGVPYNLHEW